MLRQHQVEHYREAGYLVVEDVVESGTLDELRRVTDAFLEKARSPHRFRLPAVSRKWVRHAHLQTNTSWSFWHPRRALHRSRMYA